VTEGEGAAAVAEHEAGIEAFLTPARARRWRSGPRPPRDLPHFERRLDPECAEALRGEASRSGAVLARLLAEGAPPERCVVFPASGEWGAVLPLAEAVGDMVGWNEGFVSCLPGRLALYAGERRSVWLLRRGAVGRAG
jgi:hypothetical protein